LALRSAFNRGAFNIANEWFSTSETGLRRGQTHGMSGVASADWNRRPGGSTVSPVPDGLLFHFLDYAHAGAAARTFGVEYSTLKNPILEPSN
jgi:hypothetical protein